eukprot:jgi/Chrzof1/882/Cz01g32170.t1
MIDAINSKVGSSAADLEMEQEVFIPTMEIMAKGFLRIDSDDILFPRQNSRRLRAAQGHIHATAEHVYDYLSAKGPPQETDLSLGACLMRLPDPHDPLRPAAKGAVLAEICDSINATETVPSTVSWTLFCLCCHPEVEAQVVSELISVGVPVGHDDVASTTRDLLLSQPDIIKQLPYLTGVVYEAMRLYPAGGPASPRWGAGGGGGAHGIA